MPAALPELPLFARLVVTVGCGFPIAFSSSLPYHPLLLRDWLVATCSALFYCAHSRTPLRFPSSSPTIIHLHTCITNLRLISLMDRMVLFLCVCHSHWKKPTHTCMPGLGEWVGQRLLPDYPTTGPSIAGLIP